MQRFYSLPLARRVAQKLLFLRPGRIGDVISAVVVAVSSQGGFDVNTFWVVFGESSSLCIVLCYFRTYVVGVFQIDGASR